MTKTRDLFTVIIGQLWRRQRPFTVSRSPGEVSSRTWVRHLWNRRPAAQAVHGERILTGNYTPGFRAALYPKDYRIASATIAEHYVPAPVSAVVRQLVDALIAAGRAEDDYSALATVLFDRAGL